MDMYNRPKPVSVVFIPDYLVNTLNIKGMSLADIDTYVGQYRANIAKGLASEHWNTTARKNLDANIEKLNSWFLKNISTNDIHDLIAANEILDVNLLNTRGLAYKDGTDVYMGTYAYFTDSLLNAVSYVTDNKPKMELIAHYSDNSVDLNSIILSRSSDADKAVWSTVVTENTMFVVLHSGFTNFIVYNDLKFREYFITRLIDSMFTSFGEDAVVNNRMFKSFIRL